MELIVMVTIKLTPRARLVGGVSKGFGEKDLKQLFGWLYLEDFGLDLYHKYEGLQ